MLEYLLQVVDLIDCTSSVEVRIAVGEEGLREAGFDALVDGGYDEAVC